MEKKLNLRFQKRPNDHVVHEERLVQWLDPDTGELARQPQPEKEKIPRANFTAGGKRYLIKSALLNMPGQGKGHLPGHLRPHGGDGLGALPLL